MLYTDHLGNTVTLHHTPKRIISLVPSQTEYLFDLGLADSIVGITRFCIHPGKDVMNIPRIGGTKQFDIQKIKQLQPDLIIGNKEENYEEGIQELSRLFPVWMSDIYTPADSFSMMKSIADMTGKTAEGEKVISEIQYAFKQYQTLQPSRTCAYFIWRKPYMVAGSNTFINSMLKLFGCENIFGHTQRYPVIDTAVLQEYKPDVIFLSSEPYSFKAYHIEEFREFCPESKVVLADGEIFSWYGSRMRHAPAYFQKLKDEINAPVI